MAYKKELSWILKAKDSISGRLKRVGKNVKKFAKSGVRAAKNMAVAFLAVGAAVVAMGAKFIKAYQKQAQSEAKLTSVLKATGYAAGYTTSELKEMASELQKQTGIGDETTLSMMGMLATFKQVKGDNFKRATKAILDMSVVLKKAGQDSGRVEEASLQVGKALNDPIKGISMLNRVGIQFTEQQREQIKTLQESGDLLGAQNIVLQELESQFGGAAAGIDKNVKAWDLFSASVGDAQEEIGRVITEGADLSGIFATLTKIIDDLVSSGELELWVEDMIDAFKQLDIVIGPVARWLTTVWEFYKKAQLGAKGVADISVGMIMGGESLDEAVAAVRERAKAEGWRGENREDRLKKIRQEREERKKARAEAEKAEMAEAHAAAKKQKSIDAAIKEKQAAEERKKSFNEIIADMNDRIKLQRLLNKEMTVEAEIMKAEKKLGRELTEKEKEKFAERQRELEALGRGEEIIGAEKLTERGPEVTALERIGAVIGGGRASRTDKTQNEQLKIAKQQLEVQKGILDRSGDQALGKVA